MSGSPFHAVVFSFIVHVNQVPQVTEEAALAVTSLYPTLLSLAKAYTMLVTPLFLSTYTKFFTYRTYTMFFTYTTYTILLTHWNRCDQCMNTHTHP